MRELAKDFPAGQFDPYFVVLTGDTLISEEGYKAEFILFLVVALSDLFFFPDMNLLIDFG